MFFRNVVCGRIGKACMVWQKNLIVACVSMDENEDEDAFFSLVDPLYLMQRALGNDQIAIKIMIIQPLQSGQICGIGVLYGVFFLIFSP